MQMSPVTEVSFYAELEKIAGMGRGWGRALGENVAKKITSMAEYEAVQAGARRAGHAAEQTVARRAPGRLMSGETTRILQRGGGDVTHLLSPESTMTLAGGTAALRPSGATTVMRAPAAGNTMRLRPGETVHMSNSTVRMTPQGVASVVPHPAPPPVPGAGFSGARAPVGGVPSPNHMPMNTRVPMASAAAPAAPVVAPRPTALIQAPVQAPVAAPAVATAAPAAQPSALQRGLEQGRAARQRATDWYGSLTEQQRRNVRYAAYGAGAMGAAGAGYAMTRKN